MSFPTLSPFIRHCLPTLQATLCPLPLPLLCLPTTSLVQVPRWPSTCLRTTRPCHTIYRHSGLRCRGFINTRCCRGWRSRGAGWCSTPREYRHCVPPIILKWKTKLQIWIYDMCFSFPADEHMSVLLPTHTECTPTTATDTTSMCHKLCLPTLASLSREQHGQCQRQWGWADGYF